MHRIAEHRRVLLVGNGPSIVGKPMGKAIDAFDGAVVRFNRFVLEPVECTGTRVDLWIRSRLSGDLRAHVNPDIRHLIAGLPEEIRKSWKTSRRKWFLSNGLLTIHWALNEGHEVVLHGFDHFDRNRKLHYFEEKPWKLDHIKDRDAVIALLEEGKPVSYLCQN